MEKSTFTPLYERFRQRLVELREAAGLSQRDLAARLGRERSFVGRFELGERRLDLVEVFWVLRALGQDPEVVVVDLMREFARLEPVKARQRKSGATLRPGTFERTQPRRGPRAE